MVIEQDPDELPPPRQRLTVARPAPGEGMAWIRESWRLFKLAPIPWMGMTALVLLAMMLVATYVHPGVIEILSPFVVAGYMSASRAALQDEPVTFLHLGIGFRRRLLPNLLGIGVISFAVTMLIQSLVFQISGDAIDQLALLAQQGQGGANPELVRQAMQEAMPGLMTAWMLLIPVLFATWFAPALVVFAGFSTLNGLWWSVWTCMINWRPIMFLLVFMMPFGFVVLGLSMVPFGAMVWLVFMPLFMIATYLAYRAMFVPVES